jgi:hypothetical protein
VTGAALAAAALIATAGSPAAQLAERYAPLVRLVEQAKPCGHGEAFLPAPVSAVLGNPDVALRGPWGGTNIVKVAPTARDLAKGVTEYNLDFPGNALAPGCTYDRWSHRLLAHLRPTVYARVVGEPAQPRRLALQYWFFYVFNDFNDKHEGDWEMIQLDFDARSAAEALARQPAAVGYSQHAGAERARWGDRKLQLVGGTHPVVYPALGSHANYFESKLYLGRSAAEGVGCDDTSGPSLELRPAVAVVPTARAAYLHDYPWLGFLGRWGERHPGFYNGPTGPNTKLQWREPLTWADTTWRDTSFTVPAGRSLGLGATDFFCGAIATGSGVLTALVGNASPMLLALAAIVALILWLGSRTRWDESAPFRLRRRRPWGSLVTSAARLYGRNLRLFVGIGVLFVPVGVVVTAVQYLLFKHSTLAALVTSVGPSNAFVAGPAFALGAFFTVLTLSVVQAAVALAMVELDEGRDVRARTAYSLALRQLRPLVAPLVVAVVAAALLSVSVAGIVLAFWLVVRWSLLAQVVVLDEVTSPGPLRRSRRLVRGHWWRVASVTAFVTGIALLLGPLVGTLLLFVTSASFDFVNLVSALVYAVALPFVAITTTYLYFDLTVRRQLAERERASDDVLPAEA